MHSLDFDFLSQVSAWIKDTYPDREIFGSFSKDIRASDYGSDGRYCLTITCTQNLKGVAAKRELLGQFFTPDGSRKDMTPQQEMEKILADIKKAKEVFACAPAQNADAAVTTAENAVPTATAATPTTSESWVDASASTPATSLQNCGSAPAALADGSYAPLLSMTGGAPQEKPLTFIREDKCPEFDYSGLTDQTVEDLHFAEDEYRHGKQMAERGLVHMGDAIAIAHDALCGVVAQCDNGEDGACRTMRKARNNQHSEDTFKSWCVSIGITKDTAYRLLQVAALMDNSSPRQQKVLKELSPTLLYAVAKPSAPAELVAQVKSGDITTNKQYQEALAQLKAEKSRADAAEKSAQNARKENAYFKELVKSAEAQTHKDAEKREEAESRYESALADISGLKEQNAQLKERADSAEAREEEAWKMQSKAEARAKNAEDALKKQPIVGVTDPEEVRRQADALAAEAKAQARRQIEDAQRRAREAEARYQKLQQDADGFLAPEQSCAQQAKIIADSMRSMYLGWFGLASTTGTPLARMAAPIYQVCDEIRESLEEDTTINPTAEGSVEDAEREALFE
ncbi:MAG: hypothetical protein EGQ85_08230 [Faecalibacterium prausnitzii]|nr:hypothetical protein [Faecalibacterium prausnitzii]